MLHFSQKTQVCVSYYQLLKATASKKSHYQEIPTLCLLYQCVHKLNHTMWSLIDFQISKITGITNYNTQKCFQIPTMAYVIIMWLESDEAFFQLCALFVTRNLHSSLKINIFRETQRNLAKINRTVLMRHLIKFTKSLSDA